MSSNPPPDASGIDIESGVGAESHLGYVQLRWGEMGGQLTTREARDHALKILQAADAADHDAVVMRWLMTRLSMPLEAAGVVIKELRTARLEVELG